MSRFGGMALFAMRFLDVGSWRGLAYPGTVWQEREREKTWRSGVIRWH